MSDTLSFLGSAIKGGWTSALAVTITHPIDTISRQFQVSGSNSNVQSLKQSWNIRTLYRGLGPAVATQPCYWTFFMPLYEALRYSGSAIDLNHRHSHAITAASSLVAGSTAVVLTNPLWVIRQRLQTEQLRDPQAKVSAVSVCKQLIREGGSKAFMRGTLVTLVKNTQLIVQMPLFEYLKSKLAYRTTSTKQSQVFNAFLSGSIAKVAASTIFYPADVVRTNMRYIRKSGTVTISEVVGEIYRRPGGARNFFRGIGWYWLQSATTFGLMMAFMAV